MNDVDPNVKTTGSVLEVLKVCTRLGLTSFGGPIAHLGYFHEEYVKRRKWVDEQSYADLVALCQFLPGPASSQVGIAIGIERAGLLGGLAAWVGFTLPSAIALVVFAYVLKGLNIQHAGWLHGLMIVAVAVVAQAVWSMATKLAPDKPRGTIAILAAITTLVWPTAFIQVLIIVLAGVVGWLLFFKRQVSDAPPMRVPIERKTAIFSLVLFFAFLIVLPMLRSVTHSQTLALIDSFYRAGALVFGGGHVVLPLLQNAVVTPGWLTNGEFLAGYGAAQAVPGPLFTFSAYLGAVMHPRPNGILGATLALISIFLPAFLLVIGALPFWNAMRRHSGFQSVLMGINASVVGILVAALYNPVWTSAVKTPVDFCLAIAAFGLLVIWKVPPWVVVLLSAIGGAVVSSL
ncbi:chromate transporter [Alicyclobacillus macrosporangiidus]|uniref:Chromate transporter n=1 Tax=Alicyclobacillus macrosporangiidus TaxID=392015 RepID=A0A1I7LFD4_9BACL|nr:chromate transporter [Alicyclobacillus macrosporangiidus]SFV08375.1 chromate transporter [Alicyclobacillus macrosporangiidus]